MSKLVQKNPILILLLSALTFLFLDSTIYRSGLYAHIASPISLINILPYITNFERKRPPQGNNEVFLLGNSRIEYAFSFLEYEKRHPHSPLKFINGAAPSTHEKAWYYELTKVDPTHNRYEAIIIPLSSYIPTSDGLDEKNNIYGAQIIEPILNVNDWNSFVSDVTEDTVRSKILINAWFPSHIYPLDLQDLLVHPIDRYEALKNLYKKKSLWRSTLLSDDQGHLIKHPEHWASIEGFNYDWENHRIVSVPTGMPYGESSTFGHYFDSMSDDDALRNSKRNLDYEIFWLSRIIELYKNSRTQIIILQMPRTPMYLPTRRVLSTTPDLRILLPSSKNVIYVNEDAFEFLEKPKYFFDADHINQAAASIFMEKFNDIIIEILKNKTSLSQPPKDKHD